MQVVNQCPSQPSQKRLIIPDPPVLHFAAKQGIDEGEFVRTQLSLIAKRTPRFLFRAWSSQSGGDARLNKTKAITPSGFLSGAGPANIHDIPRNTLRTQVALHLANTPFATPFSSWTQSIALNIPRVTYGRSGLGPTFISLLDTRLLPERNAVFYTPPMCQLLVAGTGYAEEYLAFGVIEHSTAHTAMPQVELAKTYHTLMRAALRAVRADQSQESSSSAFDSAADGVARLVGRHFALSTLIYMLTRNYTKHPNYSLSSSTSTCLSADQLQRLLRRLLLRYAVPDDWQHDHSIMTSAVYGMVPCYNDAKVAIAHLKLAVQMSRESPTTVEEITASPPVPPPIPTEVRVKKSGKGKIGTKGEPAKKKKATLSGGIVRASNGKGTSKRGSHRLGKHEIANLNIGMKNW